MTISKVKKHFLFIRLSAMGDIAILIPLVHAFAKAYPDLKISVLSKPFFKPIIDTIPGVHFIAAEVDTKHRGIFGLWKLSRLIRREGVDLIADTHNVLRSKILRLLIASQVAKIDKGRTAKKTITQGDGAPLKPLKKTVERYADVVRSLGFELENDTIEALPRPSIQTEVQAFAGSNTAKWLGIAPFAAHKGKEYPEDLMTQVIAEMDAIEGLSIFLFGAPDEKKALEAMAINCSKVRICAGELNFNQEINLIGQLDVMLSMDSGNGHLAAMFGVPTVSLWGVTHPAIGFAPFGQEIHCMVSSREQFPLIPTSVYGNNVPEGYEDVMRTITPASVVEKLKELL